MCCSFHGGLLACFVCQKECTLFLCSVSLMTVLPRCSFMLQWLHFFTKGASRVDHIQWCRFNKDECATICSISISSHAKRYGILLG
ncbi:hypothetical protein ACB092_M004200 [Castanea dentata]